MHWEDQNGLEEEDLEPQRPSAGLSGGLSLL